MNSDIDTIYANKFSIPSKAELLKKKQAIAAEKKLKESVTSKPFNIQNLKNVQNVKSDFSPKLNSQKKRSGEPKKKPQKDDAMQVFNHFMLGKAEIDDNMKADIIKQQNDAQLMQMLKQKEIQMKLGSGMQALYIGKQIDPETQLMELEKMKKQINNSNFKPFGAVNEESAIKEVEEIKEMTQEQKMAYEILGYAPGLTESSEEEDDYQSSSEGDPDCTFNYKNQAYWALPENVRQAIDTAKKKSKHSDFYNRLRSLNDKIGVYKKIFYTKTPKYEQVYEERKRKRLEALMRKEQAELENFMMQEQKRRQAQIEQKKSVIKSKNMSSMKVTAFEPSVQKGQQIQIREQNNQDRDEYEKMAPAGKMRMQFKETRRYESTYEVLDGTNLRKNKMGINISKQDSGDKDQQIQNLKNMDYKKIRKEKYILPFKQGSLTNVIHTPKGEIPKRKLESVKEEGQTDYVTPDLVNPDDDNDSIDSDIMKDLEAYRKEQEIMKLKNINEVPTSKSDSLGSSKSHKSDQSPVMIRERQLAEFSLDDERIKTFSQDSLRKTQKIIDKESPKMKQIEGNLGLGPSLTQRGDSKKDLSKMNSAQNLKPEAKKKKKKHLKLKINNIINDIDKSIYEINRNNRDGSVLRMFKKKQSSRSVAQITDRSTKANRSNANAVLPYQILSGSQALQVAPDRGSQISDHSQIRAIDSPSNFKKRFKAYKNTQQDYTPNNQNIMSSIDPSLQNMIQRKPKKQSSKEKRHKRSNKKKKQTQYVQSTGSLYHQQAAQYYVSQSPKTKMLPSVNSSIIANKKSKVNSNQSMDRDYSDHLYDGSTGMNIGIRTSPRNHLARAMEVIGAPSKTEDIPSFDNSIKQINRNHMTQKFVMANFNDTEDEDSAEQASPIKTYKVHSRKNSPRRTSNQIDMARAKLLAEFGSHTYNKAPKKNKRKISQEIQQMKIHQRIMDSQRNQSFQLQSGSPGLPLVSRNQYVTSQTFQNSNTPSRFSRMGEQILSPVSSYQVSKTRKASKAFKLPSLRGQQAGKSFI